MTGLVKKNEPTLIPRSSLTWLLIAYVAVIIPHFIAYLPWWIALIFFACFLWRYAVYKMRASYPSPKLKFVIIIVLIAGMYSLYGNFFNTLGCSILLMALFSLKFLEAKELRDGWILVYLAYFSICVGFLYNNGIYIAIYSLIPLVATTLAVLGFQQREYSHYSNWFMLKEVGKLLLLGIPFMVTLFIFFPRFSSMSSLSSTKTESVATLGVSDKMNPGEFRKLVDDQKHIFWAEFNDRLPPENELYWRVLTLDKFDGAIWDRSDRLIHGNVSTFPYDSQNSASNYSYVIFMEPTQQKWLATLDVPRMFNGSYTYFFDYRVESLIPITNKMRYDLWSYTKSPMDANIATNDWRLSGLTRFPKNKNPKSYAWAQELKKKSKTPDEYIQSILDHITNNDYYYSLNTVSINNNFVDDFMFTVKRGYCEHYASSMAYFLRVAGIPSRVVVGYLGGKMDYANKRIQVKSSNAHAWVEYWLPNVGWHRLDPTSAIHPSRIEVDLSEETLLQELSKRGKIWAKISYQLTVWKELIDYQWTKTILGYQTEDTIKKLNEWFGVVSIQKIVVIAISIFTTFFLIILVMVIKPWQTLYFQIHRYYEQLIQLLNAHYDFSFSTSMTPREILKKAQTRMGGSAYRELQNVVTEIEAEFYQPSSNHKPNKKVLKKALKAFKQSIKNHP